MAHEPRVDLDTLKVIISQLNGAMAEASAIVQDVDRYLSEEFDIGVWAISRPFDSQRVVIENGRECVISSHLAYGKVAGRHRLHILTATLERDEATDQYTQIVAEERTPWPLCPRETKLHSFAMLPELLGALTAKAEEIATQTSRTSEVVRQLLEMMGRHSQGVTQPTLLAESSTADLDSGLFRRSRARSA